MSPNDVINRGNFDPEVSGCFRCLELCNHGIRDKQSHGKVTAKSRQNHYLEMERVGSNTCKVTHSEGWRQHVVRRWTGNSRHSQLSQRSEMRSVTEGPHKNNTIMYCNTQYTIPPALLPRSSSQTDGVNRQCRPSPFTRSPGTTT